MCLCLSCGSIALPPHVQNSMDIGMAPGQGSPYLVSWVLLLIIYLSGYNLFLNIFTLVAFTDSSGMLYVGTPVSVLVFGLTDYGSNLSAIKCIELNLQKRDSR